MPLDGELLGSVTWEMVNAIEVIFVFVTVTVGYYLGLVIHELGHVVAAWLCGFHPLIMKVGKGRPFAWFRVRDLEFRWAANPASGFVQAYSVNRSCYRLRDIAFSLGGPMATCGLIWGLGSLYRRFGDRAPEFVSASVGVVALLQVLGLAYCLYPHWTEIDGRRVPNDMLAIWRVLTLKRRDVEGWILGQNYWAAYCFLERGQIERARSLVETTAMKGKNASLVTARLTWIYVLLYAGRTEEARSARVALVADIDLMDCPRTHVFDALAGLPIYYGFSELLEEGLATIDLALREAPDELPLKATKGCILVELGRLEEGQALLDQVIENEVPAIDQALSHYYHALAVLRAGDRDRATGLLVEAIRKYPEVIGRKRVEAMFAEDSRAESESQVAGL